MIHNSGQMSSQSPFFASVARAALVLHRHLPPLSFPRGPPACPDLARVARLFAVVTNAPAPFVRLATATRLGRRYAQASRGPSHETLEPSDDAETQTAAMATFARPGRASSLLFLFAALANMSSAHDHHDGESKIPTGDTVSKDPIVRAPRGPGPTPHLPWSQTLT